MRLDAMIISLLNKFPCSHERQRPLTYLWHLIFLLCIWHSMVCGVKLVVCIFLIMSNEYSDTLSTPRAPNLHWVWYCRAICSTKQLFQFLCLSELLTFEFHAVSYYSTNLWPCLLSKTIHFSFIVYILRYYIVGYCANVKEIISSDNFIQPARWER